MQQPHNKKGEQGFSLLEVLIAMVVMIVVTGAIFALMRDSMKTSTAAMELTDGQQALRTGLEYINRDLINTGDGLNSLSNIRVPENFVRNFLTLNPVLDASNPGFVDLGLLTTDNNLPANTPVLGTLPAATVRSAPLLTDRISILQLEQSEIFTTITIASGDLNPATGFARVSSTDINRFAVGEIYFITSAQGGIFLTITDRDSVGSPTPSLVFAPGDAYGLNSAAQLNFITNAGMLPVAICRMKIIHYYVNNNGLLMRRVFGVRNAGFNESVIAEHAVSLQFRYFLNMHDLSGNVAQPEAQLTTSEQQVETRQVEATLTVETPRTLQNGLRQQLTMTAATSVRNMQFRRAQQPQPGG